MNVTVLAWQVAEIELEADAAPHEADRVMLDAVVTRPDGRVLRVPAFWDGGNVWKVRYSSGLPGNHAWITETRVNDPGLKAVRGTFTITEPDRASGHALLRHGPIEVAVDRRHFQHADGTPFFWLADTWWFGMSGRITDAEFEDLSRHRAEQGFTMVKVVAGFCPDLAAFDPRGANEGGQPWTENSGRINPDYFRVVDQRVGMLVNEGLVPGLVGMWGYHLAAMGREKAELHWRYLVARYGAYPVTWILAGEVSMPWYLVSPEDRERASLLQLESWATVAEQVRKIDPFQRPMSAHPGGGEPGFAALARIPQLDYVMLQPGHGDMDAYDKALPMLQRGLEEYPHKPVMIGEACYEGIFGESREIVQRRLFWSSLMGGGAGFCYGANGVWQFNREDDLFGASPSGHTWGDEPWTLARHYPGARQLGLGARLLSGMEFWKFQPHPEWVTPSGHGKKPRDPWAAGIPDRVRLIYFPKPVTPWGNWTVQDLKPGTKWIAAFIDPANGSRHELGAVEPDKQGAWRIPNPPVLRDMLLHLQAEAD